MRVIDIAQPLAVRDALAAAIDGSGPPILPRAGGSDAVSADAGTAAAAGAPEALRLDAVWPDDACLVIETSGSTAAPKRVVLTAASLRASGLATERRLGELAAARSAADSGSTGSPAVARSALDAASRGAPAQWLLCLPSEYVAGAQVLARSILSGTEPVVATPGGFEAVRFAHDIERMHAGPRRTSLVPAQLLRLIEAAEPAHDTKTGDRHGTGAGGPDTARFVREAVGSLDAILVGGQATPPLLRHRAEALGWHLVTTYGASETSGGCVYNGVPLDGVEAAVVDGEVRLCGDVLAAGYLGDPQRTAQVFVRDDAGGRWYRTGDAGTIDRIDAARAGVPLTGPVTESGGGATSRRQRLSITGRLDDVIISGGEKVLLGRIERLVRGVAGYEDAVVVGVPSEQWGDVPAVVVEHRGARIGAGGPAGVAADEAGDLVDDAGWAAVRDVTAEAGRAARPHHRIRIDHLPRLVSGKPDRRALAELAAEAVAEIARRGHG